MLRRPWPCFDPIPGRLPGPLGALWDIQHIRAKSHHDNVSLPLSISVSFFLTHKHTHTVNISWDDSDILKHLSLFISPATSDLPAVTFRSIYHCIRLRILHWFRRLVWWKATYNLDLIPILNRIYDQRILITLKLSHLHVFAGVKVCLNAQHFNVIRSVFFLRANGQREILFLHLKWLMVVSGWKPVV